MQKQTVVLLLVALVGVGAAIFLAPGSTGDMPAPVMQWDTGDEVDGAQEEAAETGEVQTASFERTEAEVTPGAPVPTEAGERIDALLRGRVIDKFGGPVAGAKVWMEIGQSRQQGGGPGGRGGRGGRGGGRSRRIPEPVVTNDQGLFAFQGQAFRNLRVTLQVKSDQHAVGLFEKDIGDIRQGQAAPEVEVALGDLQLKSGGVVRGRVTDLGGNAVLGAAVTLEPDFRNRLRWQRNRSDLLPPTTTDANGFYVYSNVPEGRFAVTVLAKMHTPGRSETFEVEEDATVEVPDIALGPGYEVTGIVRDARGEPIAKANVRLRASLSQNAAPAQQPPGREERGRGGRGGRGGFRGMAMFGGRDHRTETDEEGRFLIEHLPGTLMELEVRAEGFLTYEEDEIDPRTGRPIYVTLQDGLRITGLVQTPDGLPLTSYAVQARRLRGLPDPSQPQVDFNSLWSKMSDPNLSDEGRRDLMRQMRSARDQFTRQFGDRGGPGGGRGGRGGRGGERGGERGGRGQMEPEPHDGGRFVADGLLEGVYEVLVEAPDYARYRSAEVEVRRSAAPADLTITLDRGVYVGGVVLDAYGDPIVNAQVTVRSASLDENNPPTPAMFGGGQAGRGPGGRGFDMNRMARDWMRGMSGPQLRLEARTDADGLFIVKNVPRGVYALAATAERFAQADLPAFQLNGDRSDIELRLDPLGVIYGEIAGFRPEDAGEVQVGAVLVPEDGNIMGAMMRGGFGGRGGRGGGRNMSTSRVEADGTYRLEGLTPGDYIVRTWSGGTREIMRMMQPMMMSGELTPDVSVRAGAEVRWDMELVRPQVGAVVGTVLRNGEYAEGFRVELRQQDQGQSQGGGGANDWMSRMARFGRSQSATVKQDGTFEIKDVTAGSYVLRISEGRRGGPLYEEAVQVVADATVQRSFAITTGSVRGTVTTDDGADAKSVRGRVTLFADLVEPPEDLRQAQRDNRSFDARISDGAFEISSLPAGTYLLVAQPRDRAQTSQTVVVTGAEEVTVLVGKVTQPQNGGPPK